jgi:hypothetical protein
LYAKYCEPGDLTGASRGGVPISSSSSDDALLAGVGDINPERDDISPVRERILRAVQI